MATIARINEVIVAIAFSLQVKKKKTRKRKGGSPWFSSLYYNCRCEKGFH
jgi:hypothetical protein